MTKALDRVEQALTEHGCNPRRKGDQITALCPAHDDRTPSLSVAVGTTRDIVVNCFANCNGDQVMAALGLRWTDLSDSHKQQDVTVASYIYTDEQGRPLYRVLREPGKKFVQQRLTADGEWLYKLEDTRRVLYHLPEVLAAVAKGETIYVCEGEKDVDRMRAEGVTATCNSGGAGSFKDFHADCLAGAKVVIVADRDDVGAKHAADVKALLEHRACTVDVVEAAVGKDAYDHLAAGRTIDQFQPVGQTRQATAASEWPIPTPLLLDTDLPEFPVDVLPGWLAAMAKDVANELGTPVDVPATLGLAVLASICAGRIDIHVRGEWREPTNLYLVIAMPPGSGKSPAFRRMVAPVERFENRLRDDIAHTRAQLEQNLRMAETERKRAEDRGDATEARIALDKVRTITVPPIPRLIADDATPEALTTLLAEQGGRLAVMSPEAGVFDMIAGKYSKDPNLDVYLMGWSGDRIVVDRVGRGPLSIERPLLTVGVTVQPDVIESLAHKPHLAGRGLTARFMYSMPPDTVGGRNMIDDPINDMAVRSTYDARVSALLQQLHQSPLTVLGMEPAAKQTMMQWLQDVEHRRAPGRDLYEMREWSMKLTASVLRLTAIIAVANGRAEGDRATIEDVRAAIEIGSYWTAHTKAVYQLWGTSETHTNARLILRWIQQQHLTEFSVRDAYRSRRQFERVEELIGPLELLTDSGHIRPMFDGPLQVGRRGVESPKYAVNPVSQWNCNNHGNHGNHGTKDVSRDLLTSYTDTDPAEPVAMVAMVANLSDQRSDNTLRGQTETTPSTTTSGRQITTEDLF